MNEQTKECLYCKNVFKSQRSTAKYCSDDCRVRYARTLSENNANNRGGDTLTPLVKITNDTLSKLNAELAKKGLPPIIRASELPKTEWISSRIKEIDELTGGFPIERITEVFGLKGVGKTQLMTRIVQGSNLKILYIDAENSIKQEQLTSTKGIEFFSDPILENIAETVESALKMKRYNLIVIDSVAALVPRAEMEGESGDSHMGLKARLMSQWMRKINYWLSKSKTAIVFINQQRETMNSWGTVRFTPGGYGLPYAASLRIELKSGKADKKDNYQLVTAIVEKSRFDRPYKSAQFKLYYE